MTRSEMVAALDEEIDRLEKVRELLRDSKDILVDLPAAKTSARSAGGGSTGKAKPRRMSAEGRRRIIEAQKRRWAKQRQEGSK